MSRPRTRLLLVVAFIFVLLAVPVVAGYLDWSEDYVDNNSSDVDSHAGHGTHSSFASQQAGPDSVFDTLTEANTGAAGTNYEDYTDAISDLHTADADIGTHDVFADLQDYGSNINTMTESAPSGTEVDYEYDYDLSETSTTTSSVEKVSITINPPSGTRTYLVVGMAEVRISVASYTQYGTISVTKDDATAIASLVVIPKDEADYYSFFFCAYESVVSGTGLLVDMDFVSNNAACTIYCRDAQLFAFEVTAEIEDEDLSRTTTTSATFQTKSTVTVTPSGTEEFIIFSSMVFDSSSTSYSSEARLYNGASALQTDWQEMTLTSGTAARYQFSSIQRVSISTGTTYSNQYASENTGNTCGCAYSHLIVIPTANFYNYEYTSSTGSTTLTQNTWIDKATLTWTPVAEVQHLIIGTAQTGSDSTSYSAGSGLLVSGGSVDYDNYVEDKDTSDWHSHCSFAIVTPTIASRSDKIQGFAETGATAADIQQAWLHAIQIHPSTTPAQLDLEIGWTSAQYSETNEYLCWYASTQDAEALKIDIWNSVGSAWANVEDDVIAGTWTNVSIAGYLNDATVEVRFTGTDETTDSTQSSWLIDCILIHSWTDAVTNYELDLEVQWTTADYDETEEWLCIYTGSQDAEALIVQVYSSGWVTLDSDLDAGTWNNMSIPTYLTSAMFTIRFLGGTEVSDTTQSSWQIDATLIRVYSTSYEQYEGDVLVLYETDTKSASFSRTYSELLPLYDTYDLTASLVIVCGEVLTLFDAISNVGQFIFVVLEAIGLAEIVVAGGIFGVLLSETIGLAVTLAPFGKNIMLYEIVGLYESIATAASLSVVAMEHISLYDIIVNVGSLHATLFDAISIYDTYSTVGTFFTILVETVPLYDVYTAFAVKMATLFEHITLNDSYDTVCTLGVLLYESVTISSTLSRAATLSRVFTDAISTNSTHSTLFTGTWLLGFSEVVSLTHNDVWAPYRPVITTPVTTNPDEVARRTLDRIVISSTVIGILVLSVIGGYYISGIQPKRIKGSREMLLKGVHTIERRTGEVHERLTAAMPVIVTQNRKRKKSVAKTRSKKSNNRTLVKKVKRKVPLKEPKSEKK